MKPLHRLPLDEWFDDVPHPHDSMPVATDKGTTPDTIEDTMHEKMYQIATAKYNPFAIGGSESLHK